MTADPSSLIKRLWKGTLHVVAAAIYIALVLGMFSVGSWFLALITLGVVFLVQALRYIASSMDRIAHNVAKRQEADGSVRSSTIGYKISALLVWLLIQCGNAYLALKAFEVSTSSFAVRVTAALAFVEIVYLFIRFINQKVAYQAASFGMADRSLFRDGPTPLREEQEQRKQKVKAKLEVLRTMVEKGEISEHAYLKARDKYLVRQVMESNDD